MSDPNDHLDLMTGAGRLLHTVDFERALLALRGGETLSVHATVNFLIVDMFRTDDREVTELGQNSVTLWRAKARPAGLLVAAAGDHDGDLAAAVTAIARKSYIDRLEPEGHQLEWYVVDAQIPDSIDLHWPLPHREKPAELTSFERRLTLAGLWNFRTTTASQLVDLGDDGVHEIEVLDALDSAARKLGGDPLANLYGAPNF